VTAGAPALRRRLPTALIAVYGVGVMVGAGIYVLIGAVAEQAGVWSPAAFLAAGLIASLSALSYSELAARIPEAAGAAAYVERGFGLPALGALVGLAVVAAGVVSGAAVLRGGAGYLGAITELPAATAITALGAGLVAVAVAGALESLAFAAALTLVEVAGLVLVIAAGAMAAPSPDWVAAQTPALAGLVGATVLAFFAFIGFEDIANMAEEALDARRGVAQAIVAALVITAVLYAVVALAAVRAVPLGALTASDRPLALVLETRGGGATVLAAIAVAAALNGVLAQIIMAARVLFGLGRRHRAFAAFHRTHPGFGTPVRATLAVGAVMVSAALALPVTELAGAATALLLAVFVLVNLALVRLKRDGTRAAFAVPAWVPVAGSLASAGALAAAVGGGRVAIVTLARCGKLALWLHSVGPLS
jgi:amino acid transporter